MQFDVFFSISQTPVDGALPSEARMFRSFSRQVQAADDLGYGVAWIAESHLSSEVQKRNPDPVIPHWEGEVGLNVDFPLLAQHVFARTKRIEVGSAIMNIIYPGPIVAAERVAAFLALHGLEPEEHRRIHVGFAGGRFDFMNRATGTVPRSEVERVAWKAVRGVVFREAAEIFCRLLRGDVLNSDLVEQPVLTRGSFRSDEDWALAQQAAGTDAQAIELPRRWVFDDLQIVPRDIRRELLQLVVGSHDPEVQDFVNRIQPVHVFNLSITRPEVIEATHDRLRETFHPEGGPWQRAYMPRTTFVFINDQPGLTESERRQAAQVEARAALSAYWNALTGTIDPAKIEKAADNALVGTADDVARQCLERFHPEDRLMLWFDFFNHDCDRVIANMEAFMGKVVPAIRAELGEEFARG